jgi:hypothetical protein
MTLREHRDNTLADFTVQLAQGIDLGSTDRWEVGLCEFSCPSFNVVGMIDALIYCDLIMPQFVGGQYARFLRRLIHGPDHTFKNVYYTSVEKRAFRGKCRDS